MGLHVHVPGVSPHLGPVQSGANPVHALTDRGRSPRQSQQLLARGAA
jgi:hypothetical protein